METKANFALVGAFTLAVIAAAFGFVFWFSGPSKTSARKSYQIVFDGSVSGLSDGASVLFNGLRVGGVSRLQLNPANPAEVFAQIDIDKTTPVKTDTKARLEFTGLTGVASVALSGGSPDAQPLLAADDAKMPVIRADSSQFQNLVETAQRIAAQADSLMTRLNKVVDGNADSIGATVKNVQTFSEALAANADGLKEFFGAMSDIGKTAKPLTSKLEGLTTDADSLIKSIDQNKVHTMVDNLANASSKVGTVLDSVNGFLGGGTGGSGGLGGPESKGMFGDVSEAAKSIKKLADNLDVRTRELSANLNRFAGPGLRQYEALATDGRKTLEEINRAVRSLEANPSQIIFGAKTKVPEVSTTR